MGRPRDHAPDGYVTVREAANLLGISQPAIRARIKRGTLPTKPGEAAHHYIPRGAIEQEMQLAVQETSDEVAVRSNRNTELVLDALAELNSTVGAQRDDVTAHLDAITERLDKLRDNQEHIRDGLAEAIRIMAENATSQHEQAQRQQAYQDRMIEMLDREAESYAERKRRGLPERRSLWRRLFGRG